MTHSPHGRRPAAAAGTAVGGARAFALVVALAAGALALLLAAGCAHAPPPDEPTPVVVLRPEPVATGAAAFGDVVALAQAREWTVRAVTLRGDTLVGRVSQPARDLVRIRLRNLGVADIARLDRKEAKPGANSGLAETRMLAGAAVGTMLGLVTGWLVAIKKDEPCNGCLAPFALGGALVGLLMQASSGAQAEPAVWVPIWRRE